MPPKPLSSAIPSALVGIFFVAVCASCSGRPAPDPAEGPIELVPRGANIVVHVDIAPLRATSLWSRLSRDLHEDGSYSSLLESLSRANWCQQLESVTFALSAPDVSASWVVIARGKFAPEGLLAWVRERGRNIGAHGPVLYEASHAGVRYYKAGVNAAHGGIVEVVFLGRSVVVIGALGRGRAVIDVTLRRVPPAVADANFARLLVPPASAVAWMAARFDAPHRKSLADGLSGLSVESATGRVDLVDGVAGTFDATFSTDSDCVTAEKRISDLLTNVRRNPEAVTLGVSDILDDVDIDRQGPSLSVSLRLDRTQVRRLGARSDGSPP